MTIPTANPASPRWSMFVDSQNFTVTGLDGNPVTISFEEVNRSNYYNTVASICYSIILSVSFCVLVYLWFTLPFSKLRRPIFFFYQTGLLLTAIRGLTGMINGLAPTRYIGQELLGAISQYDHPWLCGIIASLIQPFLYISMLVPLILQTRVVVAAEPRTQLVLTKFLCVSALVLTVLVTTDNVYNVIYYNSDITEPPWIYPTIKIFLPTFTSICSFIFLFKLVKTIRFRQRLGVNRLGALQILSIAALQCLIFPSNPTLLVT
jgi:hypothetical protein